jgi:hypothetical protein
MAASLLALNRFDLAAFGLGEADLASESGIPALIDEAVAGLDITSDNAALCEQGGGVINSTRHICKYDFNASSQVICEAAGGTWENAACTAAPPLFLSLHQNRGRQRFEDVRGRAWSRVSRRASKRDPNAKRSPLTDLTLQRDFAAKHLHELADDVET